MNNSNDFLPSNNLYDEYIYLLKEPLHRFIFMNDFPESDMSALVGTNAFVLQQISQGGFIPVLGTMIELPYTIFCNIPTSEQLDKLGYSKSSSQNQDLASSQDIQIKWLNEHYPKSMEKLNVDITIEGNIVNFTFYNKNDSRPLGPILIKKVNPPKDIDKYHLFFKHKDIDELDELDELDE